MQNLRQQVRQVINNEGGRLEIDWWLFLRGTIVSYIETQENGQIALFDEESNQITGVTDAELSEMYRYIVEPMD